MRPQTRQRLQAAYDAISDYWQRHGYAPTFTEVAAALGVSHQTGRKYVKRLAALRFVRYQPRKLRTVTITPRVCACGAEITPAKARIKWYGNVQRYIVARLCIDCTKAYNRAYDQRNADAKRRRNARLYRLRKQRSYAERLEIVA